MSREPFLTKLTLGNFRSIREETVEFANPLFLVGKNGSGKSNFIDTLAFLADCMQRPLQTVIADHGSLGAVVHRSTTDNEQVSFSAEFDNGSSIRSGHYSFAFKVTQEGDFTVTYENLAFIDEQGSSVYLHRTEQNFRSSVDGLSLVPDPVSLVLLALSSLSAFAPVTQALASLRVYAFFDPSVLRQWQERDSGKALKHDGSNLASVLLALADKNPYVFTRIGEFLGAVAQGIRPIGPVVQGSQALLNFEQVWGTNSRMTWLPQEVSDGTLIALALIVATMQQPAPTLIAIEEPELHLHPGALDLISEIVEIASNQTQVIIATHSPELLDAKWLQAENFRLITWQNQETHISRLGPAPVQALKQHLMGAGELLLANALDAGGPQIYTMTDEFAEIGQ